MSDLKRFIVIVVSEAVVFGVLTWVVSLGV
jgi:hypothetical protein